MSRLDSVRMLARRKGLLFKACWANLDLSIWIQQMPSYMCLIHPIIVKYEGLDVDMLLKIFFLFGNEIHLFLHAGGLWKPGLEQVSSIWRDQGHGGIPWTRWSTLHSKLLVALHRKRKSQVTRGVGSWSVIATAALCYRVRWEGVEFILGAPAFKG